MSSIKCEACGYRNTSSNERGMCVNCGAPLHSRQMERRAFEPTATVTEEPQSPISTPAQLPKHSRQTQPLLPQEAASIRPPQPPIVLRDPEESYALQPSEERPSYALQPREERPRTLQPREEMSPYAISEGSPLAYYDPAEGMRTVVREEQGLRTPQPALPPWQVDKLPFGFPRRPPELWGSVVQVQSQQERPPMVGAATFFRGLRDTLWAMPNEIRHPDQEMVQVTTIRVRKPDGVLQDARVQGYLRGANVSLGDTISIWGRRRHGAIYIYKAYNHTAKGAVSTSATVSSGPFYAYLILMLIVAILAVYYLQIPIPFLPKLSLPFLPGQ